LLISVYYTEIIDLIISYDFISNYELSYDERGFYEGFIKGKICFKDNFILHVREFVYVEWKIIRKMYAYQYMSPNAQLIFRYDNVEHHRQLNLPNFPHHKHQGSETNIIESSAPTLKDILDEIKTIK
jgi:Family of unknown function (DUF6516)